MAMVNQNVAEFFDEDAICSLVDLDESIAPGAAIHASVPCGIYSGSQCELQDSNPLALGVNSKGDNFIRVIEASEELTAEGTRTCFTVGHFQSELALDLYEGELEIASESLKIGECVLENMATTKRVGDV